MTTTGPMNHPHQHQQQKRRLRKQQHHPRYSAATDLMFVVQLLALLLCFHAGGVRSNDASTWSLALRRRRKQQSTSSSTSYSGYHSEFTCRLSLYEFIDSQHDPNTKRPAYMCSPVLSNGKVGDREYEVSTVDDALQLEHQQTMKEGLETYVTITNCVIDEQSAHVRLTDGSQINLAKSFHRTRRRKLAATQGTLTALVVRIVMNDKSPIYSTDDLYRATYQEKVSLRNQYAACSSGKLRVEPSSLGVIDARINQYSTSTSNKQAVNEATTVALSYVNSQTGQSYSSLSEYADMVLFVTPELGDFLAYASVGGWQSVYNDKWGGFVASHMHETGHNLGLLHGWEVEEYLDYTGYMGGAIVGYHDQIGFPSMCYNAENFWALGWHDDRRIEVDLYKPTLIKLAAFVDYDKTTAGEEYVIIKAGNIYIHYNRAKGINVDTYEYKDYVVLYQGTSLGSFLFAALHYPDKAQYVRTFPQGDFHAEICNQVSGDGHSTPDYLTVSLGFGDSLCTQDHQTTTANDFSTGTSTNTSSNGTASVSEAATTATTSTASDATQKAAPNDDDYFYDDYGHK